MVTQYTCLNFLPVVLNENEYSPLALIGLHVIKQINTNNELMINEVCHADFPDPLDFGDIQRASDIQF